MPVASLTSSPGASGALWSQIQQQQAQRNADQAEQNARSLRVAARAAEAVANRAQENARTVRVESSQADSRSNQASQNLASLKSLADVQSGFDALRQEISSVLSAEPITPATVPVAPVINTSGQETGTLISVTA